MCASRNSSIRSEQDEQASIRNEHQAAAGSKASELFGSGQENKLQLEMLGAARVRPPFEPAVRNPQAIGTGRPCPKHE